jgi:hypothetical protein
VKETKQNFISGEKFITVERKKLLLLLSLGGRCSHYTNEMNARRREKMRNDVIATVSLIVAHN